MALLDELPDLLVLAEVADVFRSTALNRARAGREIVDRLGLPVVAGPRGSSILVPKWAVAELIGAPPTRCPHCDREVGPAGCPAHPPMRHLGQVAS